MEEPTAWAVSAVAVCILLGSIVCWNVKAGHNERMEHIAQGNVQVQNIGGCGLHWEKGEVK